MNRRNFFSFLPLAPVVAGAAVIDSMNQNDKPDSGIMRLAGSKKRKLSSGNNIFFSSPWEEDPDKQVHFGIGEDGNLWLKTAQVDWKRVVVE